MGDPATPVAVPEPPTATSTSINNKALETHAGDQYDVPSYEPHSSLVDLKERIRHHYELASDYYYSLWWVSPDVLSLTRLPRYLPTKLPLPSSPPPSLLKYLTS